MKDHQTENHEVARTIDDIEYDIKAVEPYAELQVYVSDGGRIIRTFQTRTGKRARK